MTDLKTAFYLALGFVAGWALWRLFVAPRIAAGIEAIRIEQERQIDELLETLAAKNGFDPEAFKLAYATHGAGVADVVREAMQAKRDAEPRR